MDNIEPTAAGGHGFHRGMHVNWAWGRDDRGEFLAFSSEHRMRDLAAARYYLDGSIEAVEVPVSFRVVDPDPAKDADSEQRYYERNRAAYAGLRELGLWSDDQRSGS